MYAIVSFGHKQCRLWETNKFFTENYWLTPDYKQQALLSPDAAQSWSPFRPGSLQPGRPFHSLGRNPAYLHENGQWASEKQLEKQKLLYHECPAQPAEMSESLSTAGQNLVLTENHSKSHKFPCNTYVYKKWIMQWELQEEQRCPLDCVCRPTAPPQSAGPKQNWDPCWWWVAISAETTITVKLYPRLREDIC